MIHILLAMPPTGKTGIYVNVLGSGRTRWWERPIFQAGRRSATVRWLYCRITQSRWLWGLMQFIQDAQDWKEHNDQ